jgi:hypothetical protein
MSNEKEMNGKIPSFPILLEIPAIPPIHIKVSISELNNF